MNAPIRTDGGEAIGEPVMTAATQDVIELLDALLRIDSVNPGLDANGAGEAPLAAFVSEWARDAGLSVQLFDGTPGRPSVLVRGGHNRGGGRLLLCGHLDTVGLGDNADGLVPRVVGDRLYARGAYDMKAGLAAALIACRDAVAEGIDGEVLVAAVADEEVASVGMEEVLAQLDPSSLDAAVVTEPTEREIVIAHRGFAWTQITVTGLAAHGSRPQLGADAIVAAARVVVSLDELDQRLRQAPHTFLGPGNLHASLIEGGTEESTIPARCVFTVERRTLPGESRESVEADVAAAIDAAGPFDERITIESRTTLYRPPLETSADSPIVDSLRRLVGPNAVLAPGSYWADSALIAATGIPTVLYGPEGEGAHADVEWVSISGTRTVAEVLTKLALDRCRQPR